MTDLRPTVGSDRDTWGTKLLTWLGVSTNTDGTLVAAKVAAALPSSVDGSGVLLPAAVKTALGGSLSSVAQPNTTIAIDPATGDIVITTNGVERARISEAGAITGFAAAANTPTLQELHMCSFYAPDIAATQSIGVGIAEFALKITAASLMPWNANNTADDTNYWTAELSRWHNGTQAVIASKTTQLTGGQAMAQRTDWNYDAITFSATNQVFAKGDAVGFRFAKTGTPSNLSGVLMTVRYEPL